MVDYLDRTTAVHFEEAAFMMGTLCGPGFERSCDGFLPLVPPAMVTPLLKHLNVEA